MTKRSVRSRRWFTILLCVGLTCVSAAQAAESVPPNPPVLNEKDLVPYKPKGQATATGQVFLSLPSGKAMTQAGVSVYLIPAVPYTRYWFDRNVRINICSPKGEMAPTEPPAPVVSPAECTHAILAQFLAEKRLLPYLRTTRANPTGHFWFAKLPAGRYYLVSLLEGGGGSHQDERGVGIAWSTLDLDAAEKATNLVVTDCKGQLC